jgi:hypothetical protein
MMSSVNRFDAQDWLLVFVGAVLIGVFCMRGFGSRSNY